MVLHSDTVTMKTASLAQNGTGKDFWPELAAGLPRDTADVSNIVQFLSVTMVTKKSSRKEDSSLCLKKHLGGIKAVRRG